MRPRHFLSSFLALALTAVVVGGCGESTQDKAKDTVCNSVKAINGSINSLKTLNAQTATADGIKSEVMTIQDNLTKIKDAEKDLAADRKAQVSAAVTQFSAQLQSIGQGLTSNLTPANAKQQATTAATQLDAAFKAALQPINCS
jgi:hypothetical protein